MTETQTTFEIVLICTGNRFRSPMAEALLARATEGLPVQVRSVGTLDLGPVPVLAEAAAEASRFGIDLSAHRARTLTGESLADADLVLGFERLHVAKAVVDAGARPERTFTVPELAARLADVDLPTGEWTIERARAAVALAHEARPAGAGSALFPELADPLGRPPEVQRQIAEQLQGLISELTAALFGKT
jgi:protein-tyrosine phosphatase